MIFAVIYHPLVIREDLPKLDRQIKQRVKDAIEQKLMMHPEIFGVPLRQSLKGHRKLRVGDYRVVFRIENQTVIVFGIQHRSIVYGSLRERLK